MCYHIRKIKRGRWFVTRSTTMMKRKGYREMLRDRMPLVLSLTLKWCKAKEKWLSYVYERHIKPVEKNKRALCVKQCLGLKPRYTTNDLHAYLWQSGVSHKRINNFVDENERKLKEILSLEFKDTIVWHELDDEETAFWSYVVVWHNWFKTYYKFIENTYRNSLENGMDKYDIKVKLIQRYLSNFLPKEGDDKETEEKKYNNVNKLVDFLIESF